MAGRRMVPISNPIKVLLAKEKFSSSDDYHSEKLPGFPVLYVGFF